MLNRDCTDFLSSVYLLQAGMRVAYATFCVAYVPLNLGDRFFEGKKSLFDFFFVPLKMPKYIHIDVSERFGEVWRRKKSEKCIFEISIFPQGS